MPQVQEPLVFMVTLLISSLHLHSSLYHLSYFIPCGESFSMMLLIEVVGIDFHMLYSRISQYHLWYVFNGFSHSQTNHFQLLIFFFSFILNHQTFFNQYQLYYASLIPCYLITIITGLIAFQSAGGSSQTFKECLPFTVG